MEGFTMPYSYKLGNNGPLLPAVPDETKIKKEEFKEGGVFSKDEWRLHYERPGNSGVCRISKGERANTIVGKIEW